MATEFTIQRLQDVLNGRSFQFYPQIDSSNERGLLWLAGGAPGGSVIIADEQTRGRGRMGRVWYAPPATALMFSYILRPKADDLTYVGMMGALAVCEAVETLGVQAGIKWPNDVQIDGRKLCGVLPEAAWQGERLCGVVLGIGLNVRIDFTGTDFEHNAVSLETVVGDIDRLDLLLRLLEQLDDWSAWLSSDDLYKAWRSRLVMLGRQVSISNANGTARGIAEAVDRRGALLLRDETGNIQRMIAGDIALG
jgi:BirA family transcriptional regulator, biotin operon repressor / biotin---[acetyl-CoA-carboxylase] ligase